MSLVRRKISRRCSFTLNWNLQPIFTQQQQRLKAWFPIHHSLALLLLHICCCLTFYADKKISNYRHNAGNYGFAFLRLYQNVIDVDRCQLSAHIRYRSKCFKAFKCFGHHLSNFTVSLSAKWKWKVFLNYRLLEITGTFKDIKIKLHKT